MITFSNSELAKLPPAKPGDLVRCRCGEQHPLEPAADGSTLLLFYRCGNVGYLGAVDGRLVVQG